MAVTDDLFQLIRALTPSEKRYFKIHAKTHVGDKYKTSYEKLFDALNYWTEEDYDELLFKRKHKGKSFLKNLSVEKNYLYELILTTMRSFHDKKTIEQQINDLLLDEDFFRRKRLNEARKKAIEKAKNLAINYEKLPALLTLIEREINMKIEWRHNDLKELAAEPNLEETSILNQLHSLAMLRNYSNQLFILIRINTGKNNEQLQKKSYEIVNQPLIMEYKIGSGFNTDRHYYKIWALHHRILKNMAEHQKYTKLIFELYEIHYPHQKLNNPGSYKIALFNYLNSCFVAGDLRMFPLLLEKAQQIPTANRDEEGEDWQNLIHLELIYLNNTGKLKEAMTLSTTIEIGLTRYKNKVNTARKLALYYNLAAAFFISGYWEQAITYYGKVMADKSDAREDLKINSEFLLLACQYELQNFDLVHYALRNLQRRLKAYGDKHLYKIAANYIEDFFKHNHERLQNGKAEFHNLSKSFPELFCWLQARHSRLTINSVYLQNLSATLQY